MKIKIKHGTFTGPTGEVIKPVECMFENRALMLEVRDENPHRKGDDPSPRRNIICAGGALNDDGRIRVSSASWADDGQTLSAWTNGFEVTDPRDGTEAGKFVGELLRQNVAEEVK